MDGEWREITLGDFVRLQRGHDLTESDRRPGSVPVIGSAGAHGYHDTAKVKGPGLTIGRSGVGSMGIVTYVPSDYWPHNTVLYVTDFLGNDPRFVYYFLRQLNLRRYDSGSAQASLNRNYIYPIPIRVPNPPEQIAIAQILGALDDKIELNRRMNTTLEAMARGLFQSWFVDFDPVRAKLDDRAPAGLDSATSDLFPTQLQDSPLGLIPKGWQVVSVAETCENIFSGGTPRTQTAHYWGGGIPWLSSGETRSRFIIQTEKTITVAGVTNSSTRLARPGCTVIAGAGQGHTRGQTSLLTFESYINQSVVALAANRHVSSDLFLFLNLERRYEQFRQLSDSHSSRGSLTTKLLGSVEIVLPPRDLISKFDALVGPAIARVTANLHQSRTLAALRDTLLPKLLSGELRIPAAEKEIARHA